MRYIIFLIGASSMFAAYAVPLNKPLPPIEPKSEVNSFQNVIGPTCTTRDNVIITTKNGIIDPKYKWTKFNVHPDSAYNETELQAINKAMYNLKQIIPCVTFGIWPPVSSPNGDYVRIIRGAFNGCNSWVGRLCGRQDMNLQSPGCMGIGTIMHEMMHALGFHHEHGRPDRNDHIEVLYQNVIPGLEFALDKYPSSELSTFNVTYNYRSIMHFESDAFSSNGQPTIVAKTGEPVGPVDELQSTDIQKLKLMYNCS